MPSASYRALSVAIPSKSYGRKQRFKTSSMGASDMFIGPKHMLQASLYTYILFMLIRRHLSLINNNKYIKNVINYKFMVNTALVNCYLKFSYY